MVVLDSRFDGIDQVTDILSPHHGLAAVQVLSHGSSGTLRLGTSQLNDDTLGQNRERVASWGRALRPGGDVLLYGCNVAKGVEGMDFVRNLATLTGADVAASTDNTGAAVAGGDWALEYSSGLIDTAPLFQAATLDSYRDLLSGAAPTISGNLLSFAGSAGADVLHLRVNDAGWLEYEWDGSSSFTTLNTFTLAGSIISVDLGGGDDTFFFDNNATAGIKLTASSLTLLGGSGQDAVTISEELNLAAGLSVNAEAITVAAKDQCRSGSDLAGGQCGG